MDVAVESEGLGFGDPWLSEFESRNCLRAGNEAAVVIGNENAVGHDRAPNQSETGLVLHDYCGARFVLPLDLFDHEGSYRALAFCWVETRNADYCLTPDETRGLFHHLNDAVFVQAIWTGSGHGGGLPDHERNASRVCLGCHSGTSASDACFHDPF
mmetsp:Transcript_5687/g.12956  ORF Transcript_5687/g.12956 Transcript_5687/m.12956 type:complete len:156 (-) Transcript_5687:128-595(-)